MLQKLEIVGYMYKRLRLLSQNSSEHVVPSVRVEIDGVQLWRDGELRQEQFS